MSVAEQELQMTEEVVNPEGQTTLAQVRVTAARDQYTMRKASILD